MGVCPFAVAPTDSIINFVVIIVKGLSFSLVVGSRQSTVFAELIHAAVNSRWWFAVRQFTTPRHSELFGNSKFGGAPANGRTCLQRCLVLWRRNISSRARVRLGRS